MHILRLVVLLLAACWQSACHRSDNAAPAAAAVRDTQQAPPFTPASNAQPVVASRPADAASASAASPLPPDAAKFREERELCDHFRGEEPYDAQRRRELAQQLDRYCKGTDARLAALRAKYAGQPRVIDALKDFEAQVE